MADTNDRIDDFGALDEPPHVHCYLTHCLAAAVGFKFVDAARRVCVYTRPRHPQKTFFAVIRGVVPIHELCGALTASRLARRDAAAAFNRRRPRGVKRRRVPSSLNVIAPAAILRALANFRGCKPFKESNQPWVELQLQASTSRTTRRGTGCFQVGGVVRVVAHAGARLPCAGPSVEAAWY